MGGPEILELGKSTLEALEKGEFYDIAHVVSVRIIGQPAERIFDISGDLVEYKPFAELALREIRDVARHRRLPRGARRQRMLDTLDLAGF